MHLQLSCRCMPRMYTRIASTNMFQCYSHTNAVSILRNVILPRASFRSTKERMKWRCWPMQRWQQCILEHILHSLSLLAFWANAISLQSLYSLQQCQHWLEWLSWRMKMRKGVSTLPSLTWLQRWNLELTSKVSSLLSLWANFNVSTWNVTCDKQLCETGRFAKMLKFAKKSQNF